MCKDALTSIRFLINLIHSCSTNNNNNTCIFLPSYEEMPTGLVAALLVSRETVTVNVNSYTRTPAAVAGRHKKRKSCC